jgi:hypothetical protein
VSITRKFRHDRSAVDQELAQALSGRRRWRQWRLDFAGWRRVKQTGRQPGRTQKNRSAWLQLF